MSENLPIPVIVAGATGKMGRETIKAIANAPDMTLIGAIDRTHIGEDIGEVVGIGALEIPVTNDLEVMLAQGAQEKQLSVVVDFTHPDGIYDRTRSAIAYGVRPVIGTTGLTEAQIHDLTIFADKASMGCLIVPNFSIGMILLQQAAIAASQYFQHVEILELHHNQKADAPSGTAVKTAQMLSELGKTFNPPSVVEKENFAGARGAVVGENIRLHSVRLPGLLAHQEVIFGAPGEIYSLRHDTSDRACYMPGVLLAIRRVLQLKSLVYGLEKLL
ncbi:4-hydroxy-tetrahydrodipicolinate reductase [Tumidithrix helvetica PCC 7403]|uniref:4-hydroxy-tetrahydrodipicolinate reductase n=1 Tax=Tumidithrix helvetica TaxID=3457545 RepID=UPI003C881EC6